MINCRENYGWTQEQAAKAVGISRSNIGAYEEGRSFPSIDKLLRIIQVYHIKDLVSFLSGECEQSKTKDDIILKKYFSLKDKEKKAVDILLDLN